MGVAEDTLSDAIESYRSAKTTERARLESVVTAAIKAAAPWAVDVHTAALTVVVDPDLPAADRVKTTATQFASRWPANLADVVKDLREA